MWLVLNIFGMSVMLGLQCWTSLRDPGGLAGVAWYPALTVLGRLAYCAGRAGLARAYSAGHKHGQPVQA